MKQQDNVPENSKNEDSQQLQELRNNLHLASLAVLLELISCSISF